MSKLDLPMPHTMPEAMFLLVGVEQAFRTTLRALADQAPHLVAPTRDAAVTVIKGAIGEGGGVTIEDEAGGIGAALKLVEFRFAAEIKRVAKKDDPA